MYNTNVVLNAWLNMKTDPEPCFRLSSVFPVFLFLLVAAIFLFFIMAFDNIVTNPVSHDPMLNSVFYSSKSKAKTDTFEQQDVREKTSLAAEQTAQPNRSPINLQVHSEQTSAAVPVSNQSSKKEAKKLILFYNRPSWIDKTFDSFDNCPYKCEVTRDRKRWNESGAVIFVASENPGVPKIKRAPGQAWVFFNLESPSTYRVGFQKWNKLINWTMTYRLDSDIPLLNHEIQRKEGNGFDPFNKTKPINWVVSHCHAASKRDEFAKMLQKYIQVDIYGRCGPLRMTGCKGLTDNICWNQFFNKYFFYLSFENSFCRDYITEKAFNPLKSNIVPIVRGGAFYSKYFPLKSYVSAGDFKTVKELADHLKFLIGNEAEYDSYFDWRKYFVAGVYCCRAKSICELCRRLHYKDKYYRVYDSVHDWWHKGGNCHTVDDLHRRR